MKKITLMMVTLLISSMALAGCHHRPHGSGWNKDHRSAHHSQHYVPSKPQPNKKSRNNRAPNYQGDKKPNNHAGAKPLR